MVVFEILSPSSQQLCIDNLYAFNYELHKARLPSSEAEINVENWPIPQELWAISILTKSRLRKVKWLKSLIKRSGHLFVGNQAKLIFSLDISFLPYNLKLIQFCWEHTIPHSKAGCCWYCIIHYLAMNAFLSSSSQVKNMDQCRSKDSGKLILVRK